MEVRWSGFVPIGALTSQDLLRISVRGLGGGKIKTGDSKRGIGDFAGINGMARGKAVRRTVVHHGGNQ